MTWFLASVRDADEAAIALAGGADVIDFKDPAAGALGAVAPEIVREGVARVAGRRPVSAVLGDLPMQAAPLCAAAEAMAATGVDYLKLGIFPGGDAEAALAALAPLAARVKLVAVFFADRTPDLSLLALLAEHGFAGAMLDTAGKNGARLLDHLDIARLGRFVAECRRLGLLAGLAGALELPDIPRLLLLSPDLLGFRTALCGATGRKGAIDAESVAMVRALIPGETSKDASGGVDFRLLAARGYAPAQESDPALTDRVHLRDFVLPMTIGVYAHERARPQKVRFAVTAIIARPRRAVADLRDVFSYDVISDTIRMLADAGHVGLVETLAERIAARLLAHPPVLKVEICVEKLETGTGVVGITIARAREAAALAYPASAWGGGA
ncbi:MAG: (5-formylfuran-3-yl)methyl phosphate synthase [Acidibrevibacterium sp.]|uniref:(5-formylfuran-3-yl)methyl phosphate synthase n=1 Tax=Acidibrevibacterium sp. TaxID=2606776 RepID=UPI003D070D5B